MRRFPFMAKHCACAVLVQCLYATGHCKPRYGYGEFRYERVQVSEDWLLIKRTKLP